jgi:hypothetical protein
MSVQRQENLGLTVMQAHPAAAFTATGKHLALCGNRTTDSAIFDAARPRAAALRSIASSETKKKGNNGDW